MKTILITGGNRGLGYECVRTVAREKDWFVLIACREPQEAQQVVTHCGGIGGLGQKRY